MKGQLHCSFTRCCCVSRFRHKHGLSNLTSFRLLAPVRENRVRISSVSSDVSWKRNCILIMVSAHLDRLLHDPSIKHTGFTPQLMRDSVQINLWTLSGVPGNCRVTRTRCSFFSCLALSVCAYMTMFWALIVIAVHTGAVTVICVLVTLRTPCGVFVCSIRQYTIDSILFGSFS